MSIRRDTIKGNEEKMASKAKLDSESDEFSSSDERVESSDDAAKHTPMSAVAAEAAAVRRERGKMRKAKPPRSTRTASQGLAPIWVQWRLDLAEALAAPAVAPVLAALGLPPMSDPSLDGRYALGMALGEHERLLAALAAVCSDETIVRAMRLLSETPAFFNSRPRGTHCACGLPLGTAHRH